jgi:hypothetical protein
MNYYIIYITEKNNIYNQRLRTDYFKIYEFENDFEFNKEIIKLKLQGEKFDNFGKIKDFYEGLHTYFFLDPFNIEQIDYFKIVYANKFKLGLGDYIYSKDNYHCFSFNRKFHHNTFKKINVSINFITDDMYSSNSIYITKKYTKENKIEFLKEEYETTIKAIPENFKKDFLKTLKNTAKEHKDFFIKKCDEIINYNEDILKLN